MGGDTRALGCMQKEREGGEGGGCTHSICHMFTTSNVASRQSQHRYLSSHPRLRLLPQVPRCNPVESESPTRTHSSAPLQETVVSATLALHFAPRLRSLTCIGPGITIRRRRHHARHLRLEDEARFRLGRMRREVLRWLLARVVTVGWEYLE